MAPAFDPRIFPLTDQFNFMHIGCDEVAQIVRSMPANKSSGIDKMPVCVIKDSLPVTLPVITSLINASVEENSSKNTSKALKQPDLSL